MSQAEFLIALHILIPCDFVNFSGRRAETKMTQPAFRMESVELYPITLHPGVDRTEGKSPNINKQTQKRVMSSDWFILNS